MVTWYTTRILTHTSSKPAILPVAVATLAVLVRGKLKHATRVSNATITTINARKSPPAASGTPIAAHVRNARAAPAYRCRAAHARNATTTTAAGRSATATTTTIATTVTRARPINASTAFARTRQTFTAATELAIARVGRPFQTAAKIARARANSSAWAVHARRSAATHPAMTAMYARTTFAI